jgi:hypothetical protein
MKVKILLLLAVSISAISPAFALRMADPFIPNEPVVSDDSIEKELDKNNTKELDFDFNLKTFDSCDNMEDVM